MCIAILNKKGILPKERLRRCWVSNPHGAGFAYYNNNKITIIKEMDNFDNFYKYYKKHRSSNLNVDFILHFRIATHGEICEQNTHPFLIDKTSAFAHNGIISNCADSTSKKSDTVIFKEKILQKLPNNWHKNPLYIELISGYIGYSKLVFIKKHESFIINEDLGIWDDGNWYSNNSYKEIEKPEKSLINSHLTKKYYTPSYNYKNTLFDNNRINFEDDDFLICAECGGSINVEYRYDYRCDLCENCYNYLEDSYFKDEDKTNLICEGCDTDKNVKYRSDVNWNLCNDCYYNIK